MQTKEKRNLEETLERLEVVHRWLSQAAKRRAATLAVNLGQESPGMPLLIEYREERTGRSCEAIGYLDDYNPGDLNIFLDDSKVKDSVDSTKYAHHKMIRIYEIEKYYRLKKIQSSK